MGPKVRWQRGIRPRMQRAFFDWYCQNRIRFAIPLHFEDRTDKSVNATFAGVPRVISMKLHPAGLDVSVEWEGQWMDMLLSLDVAPLAVPGGCMLDVRPGRASALSLTGVPLDRSSFRAFSPVGQWKAR